MLVALACIVDALFEVVVARATVYTSPPQLNDITHSHEDVTKWSYFTNGPQLFTKFPAFFSTLWKPRS